MAAAFIVRFRPCGPWRLGPDSGARDRVDHMLHSDQLYSAVSGAMLRLGMLEKWLAAVFQNPGGPAVRFSSCFPFQDDLLLVTPPRSLWPPPGSAKLRSKGARFVPIQVVRRLVAEEALDEDRWAVDGLSECLVPSDHRRGPFRPAFRSGAAVDRLGVGLEVHGSACLEFNQGGGVWAVVAFADHEAEAAWSEPVKAALRLLADSGFGGKRTIGWGRAEMPEFIHGSLPDLVLPEPAPQPAAETVEPMPSPESVFWMLSLFSPSGADAVEWGRGSYSLLTRAGRVDSPVAPGGLKKLTRMVAEGSVIFAGAAPSGRAHDVSPDGFPHPVYRAGFALAISIPWRMTS